MVWGMWVREVILAVPTCIGRKKRGREGWRGILRCSGWVAAGGRGSADGVGAGRGVCAGGGRLQQTDLIHKLQIKTPLAIA